MEQKNFNWGYPLRVCIKQTGIWKIIQKHKSKENNETIKISSITDYGNLCSCNDY
jgi:hypothetical protein